MGKFWKRSTAMLLACSLAVSAANAGDIADFLGSIVNSGIVSYADETEWYIYFDNGLSEYDTVEYFVDGVTEDFVPMIRLDDPAATQPASNEHVNPEYVYVTPVTIKAGSNITFRGTASGRVYDSMSNYQPDSASQEWGYDYVDFVWTTDPLPVGEGGVLTATKNCYYAPALAMQNKYVGEKVDERTGTTVKEQFIYEKDYMWEAKSTSVNVVGNLVNLLRHEIGEGETGKTYPEDYTVTDSVGTTYKIPAGSVIDGDSLKLSAPMEITTVGSAMLQVSNGGSADLKVERIQYGKLDSEEVRYETGLKSGAAYPLSGLVTYRVGSVDDGGYEFTYVRVGYDYGHVNYPVVNAAFMREEDGTYSLGAGEEYTVQAGNITFTVIADAADKTTINRTDISLQGVFIRDPGTNKRINGVGFTMSGPGYVSFTAKQGNPRNIAIYKRTADGVFVQCPEYGEAVHPGGADTQHTFVFDEAGTYYMGTTGGGGVIISNLQAHYYNTEGDVVEPDPVEPVKPGVKLTNFIRPAEQAYKDQTFEMLINGIWFTLNCGSRGIQIFNDGGNQNREDVFRLGGKYSVENDGGAVCVKDAIGFTIPASGSVSFNTRGDGDKEINSRAIILDANGIELTDEDFGVYEKNKTYTYTFEQGGTYYLAGSAQMTFDSIEVKCDYPNECYPQLAGIYDGNHKNNALFTNVASLAWTANGSYTIDGGSKEYLNIGGGFKYENDTFTNPGISFVAEDKPGFVVVYAEKNVATNATKVSNGETVADIRYVGLFGLKDEEGTIVSDRRDRLEVLGIDRHVNAYVIQFDPATDGYIDNRYYVTSGGSRIYIYRIEVYYYGEEYIPPEPTEEETDPPVEPEEPEKEPLIFSNFRRFNVYPYNGTNRTFVGYHYPMQGMAGEVNDVNRIAEQTQSTASVSREGSFALGNSIDDGTSGQVYQTKVTFYDYFSDWELSGRALEEHNEVLPLASAKTTDKTTRREDLNTDVSFTKNINTISYSYQGDLWNQAVSAYYNKPDELDKGVEPLLFGSNSWMTGNGRYNTRERYGMTWSWDGVTDNYQVIEDTTGKYSVKPLRVVLIPDSRAYFTQFVDIFKPFGVLNNYAMGFSNSRGDDNLVRNKEIYSNPDPEAENRYLSVALSRSDQIAPYFNKEFIEGDNERNAVYGKVYEDVSFNLEYNEKSKYYVYNSALISEDSNGNKKAPGVRLTYDANKNKYFMDHTNQTVYRPANSGIQFFPMNSSAVSTSSGNSNITEEGSLARENLMFGMKMTVPLRAYSEQKDRVGLLKFSGDDDVWVYVNRTRENEDGSESTNSQIALDIGGTHGARGGVVSMRDMLAATESTFYSGNRNYGIRMVKDGEKVGNAYYEETEKVETAVFAIATNERIQAATYQSEFDAKDTAYWFGDEYTYNGTCVTDLIYLENGTEEKTIEDMEQFRKDHKNDDPEAVPDLYFKVTFVGSIKNNGTAVSYNNSSDLNVEIWYALYDIMGALDYQEDNEDETILYDLNIYCMERGLNSSNFKVALQTIGVTTRTVEKEWSDRVNHFNDHNGTVDGKGVECVDKVTLYKEEVSNIKEGTSNFNSLDQMVIRTESHNMKGTDTQSAFVTPGESVTIDLDVGASTKYAALAMNGIQVTNEIRKQFNRTFNPSDYKANADTLVGDGSKTLDLHIMAVSNDETQPDQEVDIVNGLLKIPPNTKTIRITFNAISKTGTFEANGNRFNSPNYETYLIEKTNGWLVEYYPLRNNELKSTNLTSDSTFALAAGPTEVPISESNDGRRMLNASEMRFTIIKNPINAYAAATSDSAKESYVYSVMAVPFNYELDILSDVGASSTTSTGVITHRKVFYLRQVWEGLLSSYQEISNNDMFGDGEVFSTHSSGKKFGTSSKEIYELNNYYITIIAGGAGSEGKGQNPFANNNTDRKKIAEITFDPIYYSYDSVITPVKQGGGTTFTLKEANSWVQQWMMLADFAKYNKDVDPGMAGIYGAGELEKQFPFRFYIRPEDETMEVVDRLENYYTKYRAYDDQHYVRDLEPVTLTYYTEKENKDTRETNDFYLLERADIESVIRIVNIPYGSLEITKDWTLLNSTLSLALSDPEEITVEIYRAAIENKRTPYPTTTDECELFESIVFKPVENEPTKYEVYIHGVKVGEGTAVIDNTTDEYITTIQSWVYELQDVPLYDDDPLSATYGYKYVYFAYEIDPDMEDETTGDRVKTYYDPSADTSKKDNDEYEPGEEPEYVNEFDSMTNPDDEDHDYELYGQKSPFTMHIENIVRPRNLYLSVLKTDSISGELLNNATFELYVKEEGDPDTKYKKLGEGITGTVPDGQEENEAQFKGKIIFDELYKMMEDAGFTPYHKYFKLVETVAPEGYPLGVRNVEFVFTITPEGVVKQITDSYKSMFDNTELTKYKKIVDEITGEVTYEKITENDPEDVVVDHFELTMCLVNDKGNFTLPYTGTFIAENGGTILYVIGGAGVLGLIALNICMRRKRRVKVNNSRER